MKKSLQLPLVEIKIKKRHDKLMFVFLLEFSGISILQAITKPTKKVMCSFLVYYFVYIYEKLITS